MAFPKMRAVAVGFALLGVFAAAAQASKDVEVDWPANGSIKLGMPKSPADLLLSLPGCMEVKLDWPGDKIEVKMQSGKSHKLSGKGKMNPKGGRIVVLFSIDNEKAIVVAYPEADDGGFDTRMLTVQDPKCKISKLVVKSSDNAALKNVTVGVSKEIEDLYRKAMGFEG